MTHRFHPDPDRPDPDDAILYDDCERCAEQADSLGLELDARKFARAWDRMCDVEYGVGHYRTEAEKKLGRSLYHVSILLERFPEVLAPSA